MSEFEHPNLFGIRHLRDDRARHADAEDAHGDAENEDNNWRVDTATEDVDEQNVHRTHAMEAIDIVPGTSNAKSILKRGHNLIAFRPPIDVL